MHLSCAPSSLIGGWAGHTTSPTTSPEKGYTSAQWEETYYLHRCALWVSDPVQYMATTMAHPFLSNLIAGLEFIKRDDINQSSDPRVGSARDNSTSTKVTSLTSGTNSASFSQLFATLIPVTVYTVICLLFLFIFRRRCPRVYSPRTFLSSLHPHERSAPLPSGWFNWLVPFFKVPDTAVLNQSSLDGFLFLRYLKVLGVICAVGICIVWPVLLPLHSYGGMGNRQLDKLTFGNILNPSWYYVHAFLAWIYFGFIMYMISRECVYYINLRQAYLIAPYYAKRLSSRTVLFTCVPQQVLDEAKLRKVFGDSVRNVWIPRYTEDLDDLVRERDQTALRLEKAEIELIKMANLERTKKARSGHPDIEEGVAFDNGRESYETKKSNDAQTQKDEEQHIISSVRRVAMPDARHSNEARQSDEPFTTSAISSMESPSSQSNSDKILELKWGNHGFGRDGPPPDVNGSVAAQWIPAESRPSHRPLANYGRRVDTIKWTRNRLKELAPRIAKLRRQHKSGKGRPIPAAFIEFDTQTDAQSAYQSLAHHRAFHMQPFIIGLRPQEIEWNTLRMFWWERIVRGFAVNGFIAVMVIFWSIPAALIGIVSNVKFLSTEVFFLHWIDKLPAPILGFISGMVPAVALAGLMALVPGLMRMCARQAGTPTSSMVELFVQQTYFIFQVVQVFLITTLTSAASAAITNIIKDPMSARDLLSQNLPKASNFYVSYFILQGLAMSATRIVHLPSLLRFYVLKTTDNPRFISNRWHRLRVIRWGSVYPVFSNIGVIAVSYSMIAPLTLGFAALAFYIVYTVYRYNLLYVYSSEIDTRGALYPHALKQTFTGVYLAEICLFGLFGLQSAFGPLVIMVGLLIFTFLVHISLNDALGPLLYNLPKTLAVQELYDQVAAAQAEAAAAAAIPDPEDPSNFHPPNEADLPEYLRSTSKDMEEGEQNTRAVEGLERGGKLTINFLSKSLQQRVRDSAASAGIPPLTTILAKIDIWTPWISPTYMPDVKPNFLLKWLHPEIFADHHILSKTIPKDLPDPEYPGETARDAYWPPSVVKEAPILWIPRDKGGVSRQEVAHCRRVGIECTDRGVGLDEKNRLVFDLGAKSPVLRERIRY